MDKRHHQRIGVDNFNASLSDGVHVFSGTVSSISRYGILFRDFSPRTDTLEGTLVITISTKSKTFQLQVEPKWISTIASENKMGLVIINPSLDWTMFAMICEPADADIWTVPA